MLPFRSILATAVGFAILAAGCVTPSDDIDAAGLTDDATALLAPVTELIEGSVMVSVATPMRTVNYGGAYAATLELEENATGYVIELEWTAKTPASETLSVWVREAGVGSLDPANAPALVTGVGEPLAKATGKSPLRIVLPIEDFPADITQYEILVRAAAQPAGVAVEQPFGLHLTKFVGLAFDPDFSAVEAQHAH